MLLRFLAAPALAALAIFASGCSAPASASSDDSEQSGADEGALHFGDTPVDVLVGRAVITDLSLTNVLLQSPEAKKVRASNRDPELGGGLVFLAGGTLDSVDYGILCTGRDGTCVVRWLTRTDDVQAIPFKGQLGARLRAVMPASGRFEGDAVTIECDAKTCSLTGLEPKDVTLKETRVGLDAVRAFAGF